MEPATSPSDPPLPAEFFQAAANRLLSGKPIHLAWQDCLTYLQRFIPADYFSLHLFDVGNSVVETVVDATADKSEPVSHKTTLTPEARKEMVKTVGRKWSKPKVELIDDLSAHEMSRQLGADLGTPKASSLAMDLIENGRYLGIAVLTHEEGEPYTAAQAELMLLLHAPLAATASRFHRMRELERVRDFLSDQAAFLRQELLGVVEEEIIGAGFGLKGVMDMVARVAETGAPVLILGETGVGKEVVAGAIHRASRQQAGPFIKVNCGSIPSSLLESELFGHEKGAFTGAVESRPGYFERADGGTIFLDEVAELSPEAQVRLLRVLQDQEVVRVGGKHTLKLDIRVLAATHRDLPGMVRDGSFRQDLFFRLNVFPIEIPSLRERREDIPALAYHFLSKTAKKMALLDLPKVAPGAVDALMDYPWPGNVRELQNVIERQVIINRGGEITFDSEVGKAEASAATAAAAPPQPLEEAELNLDRAMAAHISKVLRLAGGKVEGPGGAAELLGLNPRTLQSRMKKLGVPFGRKARGLYG